MRYFPINIDIKDKKCVVIGGGNIAGRKIASLIKAGAAIEVIAPEVDNETAEILKNNNILFKKRAYQSGDLKGATLAFVAINSDDVSKQVAQEAQDLSIPINVADVTELCSFTLPSITEREELLIAVSTGGNCPALSRAVRLKIEENVDEAYGELLIILTEVRQRLIYQGVDTNKCRDLLNKLIYSDILHLLRKGRLDEVEAIVEKEVASFSL